jgi:predicted ribosome quality control (RQC) complex YloA/Tae2 family protein
VHQQNIKAVVEEIIETVAQRPLGPIHQLSPFTLVVDFRLRQGIHLLISADPRSPRIHLVTRKMRELERSSIPAGPFVQFLRSELRRSKLLVATAHDEERVVELIFFAESETGTNHEVILVVQLTGRSANLLLLDQNRVITQALRPPRGEGQQIGEKYQSPPVQRQRDREDELIERGQYPSLSAALDAYYTRREEDEAFKARLHRLERELHRQIRQKQKLSSNLRNDLQQHGDPEEHKRLGDLLLANIATAERQADKARIKDYYSEGEPLIELTIPEEMSLQDFAARCFVRYSKAKRAIDEIAVRSEQVNKDLVELQHLESLVMQVKSSGDESTLAALEEKFFPATARPRRRDERQKLPGIRRYLSSDEYEILVGRAARTNDQLTFKVARPNDLWLHAADYPGSHVVVRNHARKEIPHRTIVEAAQLAARFSQASEDSKVDVHYTARKYLSKPKGAAPGLVRLSQFKTITVTPKEAIPRLMN